MEKRVSFVLSICLLVVSLRMQAVALVVKPQPPKTAEENIATSGNIN